MPDNGDYEFAQLAYQAIVIEKMRELQDVASGMGLKYDTLHSRLNQRVHFRPNEIRALLKEVPDPRLIMYLIELTPYIVAERAEPDDVASGVLGWIHKSLYHIVDTLKQANQALRDKFIDHQEREALLEEVSQAEIALASVKIAITEANSVNGANRAQQSV